MNSDWVSAELEKIELNCWKQIEAIQFNSRKEKDWVNANEMSEWT